MKITPPGACAKARRVSESVAKQYRPTSHNDSSCSDDGGGGVARQRSLERCREICQATCRSNGATGQNSTEHSPQVRTSSDSRFAKPHAVGTRLNCNGVNSRDVTAT
ncbi:hypothetical protein AVEN_108832-1 [Araneus ventricosus]|uniref:Uncharacterized protein n=1 Tax=Araneus ventricosus TaxID=182803 RepID=A0A4Y2CD76_ARAVE|nr:hypothetical protein AVEN_108832-1 [Araneus ventricosus]